MKLDNLCIPIYLNQKIVFDLLAIMEDGFSQFRAVKNSTTELEVSKSDINSKFGVSNVFALLGITLSGSLGNEEKNGSIREYSEEKVHTPTSLFSMMRSSLIKSDSLKSIKEDNLIAGNINTGDFIEFEGILRKNPMVYAMELFVQLFGTFMGFMEVPKKSKSSKHKLNENEIVLKQMKTVLKDLTQSNSVDLIVEIGGNEDVQAVLSAELDFFNDRNATEIIDGRFKILGKVIRVVETESDESINLLRKTSFGIFSPNMINDMMSSLKGLDTEGINIPKLVTEIKGPAIQVVPIAIYA